MTENPMERQNNAALPQIEQVIGTAGGELHACVYQGEALSLRVKETEHARASSHSSSLSYFNGDAHIHDSGITVISGRRTEAGAGAELVSFEINYVNNERTASRDTTSTIIGDESKLKSQTFMFSGVWNEQKKDYRVNIDASGNQALYIEDLQSASGLRELDFSKDSEEIGAAFNTLQKIDFSPPDCDKK